MLVGQQIILGWTWAKRNGGTPYELARVEAVGFDWVVLRSSNGDLSMGSFDPLLEQHQQISIIES